MELLGQSRVRLSSVATVVFPGQEVCGSISILFQCSMFVQYSVPLLSTEFLVWVHPHLTPYVVPLIHISLTGSVYSVVSVALERFITVCFPFTQCQVWQIF